MPEHASGSHLVSIDRAVAADIEHIQGGSETAGS